MKWVLISFCIVLSCYADAQTGIINTVAGGGTGYLDSVIATSTGIPNGLEAFCFDRYNNYYFSVNSPAKIFKVDTAGYMYTIAGSSVSGFSGDSGLAIYAELNDIGNITFDKYGNLFFSELTNYDIRKIDMTTGIIYKVAGTGSSGYSGDGGPAIDAQLSLPTGICFDTLGNLYIADAGNYRIRRMDTNGIIHPFAGNGINALSIDGRRADSTSMHTLYEICFDKTGNLNVSEGSEVFRIDTVGIIHHIAGNGLPGSTGDEGLADTVAIGDIFHLAFDTRGTLYLSDASGTSNIRAIDTTGIIHHVTGRGHSGFVGDGGLADTATLSEPRGIGFDLCGNLYVADNGNNRIRKVTFNPSSIITLTLTATPADTLCTGTAVSYSVAGGAPPYQWVVNGSVVGGATNSSYTYAPANGDSVRCAVGAALCNLGGSSNTLHMVVMPYITPTISITASPTAAAVGSVVTLTATYSGVGGAYSINWYDNGSLLGSSTSTAVFTYTKTTDTDHITATIVPAAAYPDCYDSAMTTTLVVTNITGIPPSLPFPTSGEGVSIFPNPAGEVVYVGGIYTTMNYKLTNTIGITLLTGMVNAANNAIPLTNLPRGIYLLALTGEDGYRVVRKVERE